MRDFIAGARSFGVWSSRRRGGGTPAAPVISSASIVGSGEVGSQLTLNVSRTGYPTPAMTYVWRLDGSPISGATNNTYTPVSGDLGGDITCAVTATNSEGSDSETTAAVTVIEATSDVARFDSTAITFDSNQRTFDEAA